jgi:O-antigen/teichoic acid export membrane protein
MFNSENNKRIARNTLLLYFRMLLTMVVSLYTVRVVLNTLGIVDYGIFNVVAGIVTTFSFLSVTLATATQRFFSFELGRNNYEQLKKTFSMTMTIYIMVAIIILVLAETLGLWFLNTKMSIPAERMEAANWIYQFSILSFMMTMFTIPYDAAIIAHERMDVYAYVSMIEVSLKLLIVYLLMIVSMDKLKLYAILILGVTTIITLIYRTYCQKKFDECHYSFYWDSNLFKTIAGYSGWNLFGSLAGVFNDQGINILLNIFFNPVINAARGIAFQISNSINLFVSNFSTAVNPQIIKYYAQNENQKMQTLVFQSSKFSYFLLFIITMPVLLETNLILSLWLKAVPEYVVLFTRLVIITTLIDSLSGPLITSALATGKIKYYQIIIGGFKLFNLPICFFFLWRVTY